MKKTFVSAVLTFFFSITQLVAQSKNLTCNLSVDSNYLKNIVTYLSDDYLEGRGCGTKGGMIAGTMITSQFKGNNMIPFYHRTFTQSFKKDTIIGRNIIGVVRAKYYSEKYIVISAHYDHLGILEGKIYNGADDNASGVAAMLTLSKYFSQLRNEGKGLPVNLIFAAFDGKEYNMAGSENFISNLPVSKKNIICDINIDQIGSIFAPPSKDTNYILVLGTKSFPRLKSAIEAANNKMKHPLEINYDFYGSKVFAELFYKISDQNSFVNVGIPSLFFTSGIHMHTYKPTDDYYFINFPILFNRTVLIKNIVEIIASSF